jgi:hypothetical protein
VLGERGKRITAQNAIGHPVKQDGVFNGQRRRCAFLLIERLSGTDHASNAGRLRQIVGAARNIVRRRAHPPVDIGVLASSARHCTS